MSNQNNDDRTVQYLLWAETMGREYVYGKDKPKKKSQPLYVPTPWYVSDGRLPKKDGLYPICARRLSDGVFVEANVWYSVEKGWNKSKRTRKYFNPNRYEFLWWKDIYYGEELKKQERIENAKSCLKAAVGIFFCFICLIVCVIF